MADEASLVFPIITAFAFVFAVLGFVLDSAKELVSRALEPLSRRPKLLGSTFIVSTGLCVATSSLCVTLDNTQGATERYKARLLETTKARASSLKCESDVSSTEWHFLLPLEPAWEEHFFFHGNRIVVVQLCGGGKIYEVKQSFLGLGRSARLHVPSDFALKDFHVIRLVPWQGVLRRLRQPGNPAPSGAPSYTLRVKIGPAAPLTISDIRTQLIYFGAGDDVLHDEIGKEHGDDVIRDLELCLNDSRDEALDAIKKLTAEQARFFPTAELIGGETIEVFGADTSDVRPALLSRFAVDRKSGVQTVCLSNYTNSIGGKSQ